MAELTFYTGTMSSSKSTLALQMDYNRRAAGQKGLLLTSKSREGSGVIASRLGVSEPAIEIADNEEWLPYSCTTGVDYVICDEVQFYNPYIIDDMAYVADAYDVPIFTFGILTDFQSHLFPGSKRLIELADRVEFLQLDTLCWCGKRGTMNARVINGSVVHSGDQIMVGDVNTEVGYKVLCRNHWRNGELS